MGKIKFIVPIVALLLGYITPPTAIAEQAKATIHQPEQGAEDSEADIDEEALEILKKATDYLTGLKHFIIKVVDTKDVVQASGQKIQFASTIEIAVRRPNQLFGSWIRDDGTIRQFFYNGKTVTIYEDTENVFGQIQTPDTIDEMFDYVETVMNSSQPLADLLDNDLSHLAELPLSGSYVGVSYLDSIACDHLAFRGETVDWQLWIDRGEKPLIQKMVITYRQLSGEPQYTARLIDWDIQPNISDDLFEFSPPEGARQIKIFVSERGNPGEGGGQ
jgi:hypothetical protein